MTREELDKAASAIGKLAGVGVHLDRQGLETLDTPQPTLIGRLAGGARQCTD